MKTSKLYFFVIAFLALSISMISCSGDDGEAGLIGPKGDQGEQGVAGPVGPAGDDGSQMYSGEGEPEATVGVVGDYCLDLATGILYGPKVNNDNWTDTDEFSLKGADGSNGTDGANGSDGSTTLSGMGVPDNSIGVKGDYYLDKENSVLYGPKADIVLDGQTLWGAGLELKGADGNANVKSYVFSVSEGSWILNTEKTKLYAYDDYISLYDKITDDIVESGVVLIYRMAANYRAILLPSSTKTSLGNLLTESFIIGGQEKIYMEQVLFTYANVEEELAKAKFDYRAVIITGELASEVMSKADDQIGFEAAALKMGIVE